MKYTTQILIHAPLEEVILKLHAPKNGKHWQRSLVHDTLQQDTSGKESAKMELEYKIGERKMVLTETVLKNRFLHEFHAKCDTKRIHKKQQVDLNDFKNFVENGTWVAKD